MKFQTLFCEENEKKKCYSLLSEFSQRVLKIKKTTF